MGVFNKTIILLALVGYEMIIANSALRAFYFLVKIAVFFFQSFCCYLFCSSLSRSRL